nr:hypothetical protein [uncultured Carboxylicivirga sp.]
MNLKIEFLKVWSHGLYLKAALIITLFLFVLYCFLEYHIPVSNYLFGLSDNPIGELLKVTLQVCGGLFILYGLYLNHKRTMALELQARVAEDGNITDRFQKAIEQITNEKSSSRVGGIHSLARIAKESIRKESEDWKLVVDVFQSFICDNFFDTKELFKSERHDKGLVLRYLLVDELIKVQIKKNKYKLRFNEAVFNQFNFEIENAEFVNCDFQFQQKSIFRNCDFIDCSFHNVEGLSHIGFPKFSFCRIIRTSIELKNKQCYFDFYKSSLNDLVLENVENIRIRECLLSRVKFTGLSFDKDPVNFFNNILYSVEFDNYEEVPDFYILSSKAILLEGEGLINRFKEQILELGAKNELYKEMKKFHQILEINNEINPSNLIL